MKNKIVCIIGVSLFLWAFWLLLAHSDSGPFYPKESSTVEPAGDDIPGNHLHPKQTFGGDEDGAKERGK